jgi:hypothetical protein
VPEAPAFSRFGETKPAMTDARSSPAMKMCESEFRQEEAAGLGNGAVPAENETGQADMLHPRMEQLSRERRYP